MGDEYGVDDDIYEHDVRGITTFLRDCWFTQPNKSFGEILDEVFGGNVGDMTDDEVMETLKEFLLQNQ